MSTHNICFCGEFKNMNVCWTQSVLSRGIYGPLQVKKYLWTCVKYADSDHPMYAKYADSDHPMYAQSIILLPVIHVVVFNDSVNGQWRSWSDCTDEQADLGLRCPYMPKDMFLHGIALLIIQLCFVRRIIHFGQICLNYGQFQTLVCRSLSI